jgi:hypothetical protein
MGKENLLVLYFFVANVEKSLLFTLRPVLADLRACFSRVGIETSIGARSPTRRQSKCQYIQVRSTACELTLRIVANTRWSRADENGNRMAETQLAA